MNQQKTAYILGLLAVFLWSTVATAFKIALQGLTVLELLLISSIVSFVFLFALHIFRNKNIDFLKQGGRAYLSSAILGFLNPFAYYIFLFYAYDLLPAQEALSLNYSWAVALSILAVPLLKQKLSWKALVSLCISFLGVIIIASKGNIFVLDFNNAKGVSYALVSAIIWALYWIYNIKDKREADMKLATNFFFGSIYIIIYFFISDINIIINTHSSYILAAIYIGLFEMGLTFILWMLALEKIKKASQISGLIYLSPFLSLIFIAMILGEVIVISTIIGLIFIILGIFLQKRF